MLSDALSIYNAVDALKCLAVDLYDEGNFVEARRRIIEALRDAVDLEQRARLYINWGMIERAMLNNEEALFIHQVCAPLVGRIDSHEVKGHQHNGLALTYRRMRRIDDALREYREAQYHYEQSDEYQYAASVHNNIAFLLICTNRPDEAIKHAEVARSIYARFDEKAHVAQVDDTIAQAYVELEDYKTAYKYSDQSVSVLIELPEENPALQESLKTMGKVIERLRGK